jgi:hypothetical protein
MPTHVENRPGVESVHHPSPTVVLEESRPWSWGPWGTICLGAVVGFAITFILATLGAAVSASIGTWAERKGQGQGSSPSGERALPLPGTRSTPETPPGEVPSATARGVGIGGAIWSLVTLVVAGFAGGWIVGRMSEFPKRHSWAFAIATWITGAFIFLAIATIGLAGLGGAMTGLGETLRSRGNGPSTEDMKAAGAMTSVALWGFFVAQMIGLASTYVGTRRGADERNRAIRSIPAH